MLEKILEKIGKNKFVQAGVVASVLSYSTIATADPNPYPLTRPKTEYSLEIGQLNLDGNSEQLPINYLLLAQAEEASDDEELPPYLRQKKSSSSGGGQKAYYFDPSQKKKKKREGETPDYLQPGNNSSISSSSADNYSSRPRGEGEGGSSSAGWGLLIGGSLSILGGAWAASSETCMSDAGTNYQLECKPNVLTYLGYIAIGGGALMAGLGLWDILD